MLGERLKRARMLSGLSLRGLGERVGLSHTAIQKFELGILTPSSRDLLKLAKGTGVKTEYFFRPSGVTLRQVEFRKKANLGKAAQDMLVLQLSEQVERRAELVSFFAQWPGTRFSLPAGLPERIRTPEDLETAAEVLRRAWDLGQDPILDMVDALERGGIWVFMLPSDAEGRMNGLCALAGDVPVVAVAETWPGDRQRFTLAHELGHLVISGRLDSSSDLDEEKACHLFAGAFILPRAALIRELGPSRRWIEWRELAALKMQFGLSMAASLHRARSVGILPEEAFSRLYKAFSRFGWRKAEPVPVGKEQVHVFGQLVFHALAENLIGESKAAELLNMSLVDFRIFRTPTAADANPAHQ